jgi:hypothetical protein
LDRRDHPVPIIGMNEFKITLPGSWLIGTDAADIP